MAILRFFSFHPVAPSNLNSCVFAQLLHLPKFVFAERFTWCSLLREALHKDLPPEEPASAKIPLLGRGDARNIFFYDQDTGISP
jgi:hypothetical protein